MIGAGSITQSDIKGVEARNLPPLRRRNGRGNIGLIGAGAFYYHLSPDFTCPLSLSVQIDVTDGVYH